MSDVIVYHLKKRQNRHKLSNKATHRLVTMTLNPSAETALVILKGEDPDLEYAKVAKVFSDEPESWGKDAFAKTQNTRGQWSDRLDPKSKFLSSGSPRSSMIGDVLVRGVEAILVTPEGFSVASTRFYED